MNGRDALPIPKKVDLDVEYLQRRSFFFDINILWLTFVIPKGHKFQLKREVKRSRLIQL